MKLSLLQSIVFPCACGLTILWLLGSKSLAVIVYLCLLTSTIYVFYISLTVLEQAYWTSDIITIFNIMFLFCSVIFLLHLRPVGLWWKDTSKYFNVNKQISHLSWYLTRYDFRISAITSSFNVCSSPSFQTCKLYCNSASLLARITKLAASAKAKWDVSSLQVHVPNVYFLCTWFPLY